MSMEERKNKKTMQSAFPTPGAAGGDCARECRGVWQPLARDVVRNILAGYYMREHFSLGDEVEIEDEIGTLDAIGTVNAEIVVPGGRRVVPNSHLTGRSVKIKAQQDGS